MIGIDGANLRGANIVENTVRTSYHSVVFELKRRMSSGLQFDTSYAYGRASELRFLSLRPGFDRMVRDSGEEGDVTQAFKLNGVYELPFGRQRRFATNVNGVVDRIIRGWQVAGSARVQSGRLVDLGNVQLVGMTRDDLQDAYPIRIDDQRRVWMFPEDIVRTSRRPTASIASSGYAEAASAAKVRSC